jgi:predicted DNA-binding protein
MSTAAVLTVVYVTYTIIGMPATATIRVTPETRDRLNRLSSQRGISAGELVDELATHAEDQELLEATARHYDDLQADPEAWASYRDEVSLWDSATGDGISATA